MMVGGGLVVEVDKMVVNINVLLLLLLLFYTFGRSPRVAV